MEHTNVIHHIFDRPEEAAKALASAVANDLQVGLDKRGGAVLAVSGGRTPRFFFKALSQYQLVWQNIIITLVDERWVPENDERSNAKLVKDYLLQEDVSVARFIPLYRKDIELECAALNPSENVKSILQSGFDAVVLGLGSDGHTASFFPGGDNLAIALYCASMPQLVAMHALEIAEPRITFSASALLRTRGLYLQMEGKEKADVFTKACQQGPISDLPIRVFIHQSNKQLDVFQC